MFLSILLPLSRNLTPSLRTTSYVHESQRWRTFSLFALSELVCTKNVFCPILWFPLLIHPKHLPLWSITDRQTDRQRKFFTPCYLSSFFSPLSARGPTYPQAQLYWAGRTMGWMADELVPMTNWQIIVPPYARSLSRAECLLFNPCACTTYTRCAWAGGTTEFSRIIDRICWSCFFVLCFMSHRSHLLFPHGVELSHTHLHTHVEIYICGLLYIIVS